MFRTWIMCPIWYSPIQVLKETAMGNELNSEVLFDASGFRFSVHVLYSKGWLTQSNSVDFWRAAAEYAQYALILLWSQPALTKV
jgi:hypothetical protein